MTTDFGIEYELLPCAHHRNVGEDRSHRVRHMNDTSDEKRPPDYCHYGCHEQEEGFNAVSTVA